VDLRHSLRRIAPALLAAMLSVGAQAQSASPRATKYYESALARFEKKDLAGAVIELKNGLRSNPKFLPLHVLMGRALLLQGEAAAAEVSFNQALSLGVSRSEVVVLLARALVAQGRQPEVTDPQRFGREGLPGPVQVELLLVQAAALGDVGDIRAALEAVGRARTLAPSSAESWIAEVPLRIRLRQFKEANAALEQARRLDPEAAGVQLQSASLLHAQGNLPAALQAYESVVRADPRAVDAQVARAGLLIDLGRQDEAAKAVAALTRDEAVEPRGWYLSALLAQRTGNAQAVRAAYSRITALIDPVPIGVIRYRPQLLMVNGQAHFGLGEPEKALPYFEAFQNAQGGTPVAKILATIYTGQGNAERAIETLEQYLRAAPNDAQAIALLASAYMSKGHSGRAAELMERVLRSRDDADARTAYGLALLGSGQASDALAQLETAYRKNPKQTQAAAALVPLYLRSGRTAKALALAETLCRQQPKNAGFQNLLGMAKAQARDLAGARAAFAQAIKLDAGLQQARIHLARTELAGGAPERAAALFDEVLKAQPDNTDAMLEQAALAERRGRPEETLRWLQKAHDVAGVKDLRASLALVDYELRHDRLPDALAAAKSLAAAAPDSLPVLLALARVQLRGADAAGARASLTAAGRAAPYDAGVHVEIALLQLAAADLSGAAYSLDKALAARPDDLRAQALLTEVEMRRGELDKAQARAQQILRREPRRAIGSSLLGDIALARGDPQRALEMYRHAHQIEPSADTLGRLLRSLAPHDAAGAEALARKWLAGHPDDPASRRQLAELLVRRGDMAAARVEYELLRRQTPGDVGVLNDLANVLLRVGDAQAGPVAEQALTLAPTNVNVIDTAGWIALQSGKTERALQLLRDARLREPGNLVVRYHLASALAKAGRRTEAREELAYVLDSRLAFDDRPGAEALMATLR